MNEFLVLVPTTQKLLGITDIVEENKGVLPVVCVTNELKSLPISNEYKNFVQNPTGIIENFTNISSYRIDLTDEINTGNSWQLSFAIAHLLHHKNLLIFSKSKKNLGDTKNIIWSSGRLNKNLDLISLIFKSKFTYSSCISFTSAPFPIEIKCQLEISKIF